MQEIRMVFGMNITAYNSMQFRKFKELKQGIRLVVFPDILR